MDLPTYTNIWKIEKRLYKLYDFRLPTPLPVGQIVAFAAIAVPYAFILTAAGLPLGHTWFWLYALPPGAFAWLVTRPVLEGKRLSELAYSQLRYLAEPRTWCRMAPVRERDVTFVMARVWRAGRRAAVVAVPEEAAVPGTAAEPGPAPHAPVSPDAAPAPPGTAGPAAGTSPGTAGTSAGTSGTAGPGAGTSAGTSGTAGPAAGTSTGTPGTVAPAPQPQHAPATYSAAVAAQAAWRRARSRWTRSAPGGNGPDPRPIVRLVSQGGPLHLVERALRSAPASPAVGPVLVVPGGHRPGKPDPVQRDQARARLPLAAPAHVVVLGCAAGAGQTVVTLLTGQLLASLRGERVAVVDLGRGRGSLSELARSVSALLPGRRVVAGGFRLGGAGGPPGPLQVISAADGEETGRTIDSVVKGYPLALSDPDGRTVPRSLRAADQLVLVAPASAGAARSLAMTLEWLEMNGHGQLAAAAVVVLNGAGPPTSQRAAEAVAIASSRCQAVVRVPWDERLGQGQALAVTTVHAFTALAGVLVTCLAGAGGKDAGQAQLAGAGGPAQGSALR